MITNPVLETKYQTQRELDEEAGHDVRKYAENVHQIILDIETLYGIQWLYSSPQEKEKTSENAGPSKAIS